jgi:hypothetical protein
MNINTGEPWSDVDLADLAPQRTGAPQVRTRIHADQRGDHCHSLPDEIALICWISEKGDALKSLAFLNNFD